MVFDSPAQSRKDFVTLIEGQVSSEQREAIVERTLAVEVEARVPQMTLKGLTKFSVLV